MILYIYMHSFYILFHYGLSQDIEYNFLCYTEGPCCFIILYISVCHRSSPLLCYKCRTLCVCCLEKGTYTILNTLCIYAVYRPPPDQWSPFMCSLWKNFLHAEVHTNSICLRSPRLTWKPHNISVIWCWFSISGQHAKFELELNSQLSQSDQFRDCPQHLPLT